MDSTAEELVLTVPRDRVPGGCDFTGVRATDVDELRSLHAAIERHGVYLPRSLAEENPAQKQVIPYVVVRDGERIFLMERTRAGGDARLHLKASIGVGGHLNPVDHGEDPLMDGLRREWSEELATTFEPRFNLVGFLNDDTNAVGAVHLGVVFTVEANGRRVQVLEHDKLTGRFASADEVRDAWDRLETWSQLVSRDLLGIDSSEAWSGNVLQPQQRA
jgi:predicted NUDIX family phosphoesterase